MNNWQAWQIHLNRLRAANSQPSWVVRVAAICAAAVIIIPLALLALAALIVGALVFAALALLASGITIIRSLLTNAASIHTPHASDDDGRRNVRVIRR